MRHFLCGIDRVKYFVNVCLHCQQPEKDKQMSTLPPLEKFLRMPMYISHIKSVQSPWGPFGGFAPQTKLQAPQIEL